MLSSSSVSTSKRSTATAVESLTRHVTLAVVGSGFAGLAAAIEASKLLGENSKILVIEKMDAPGGNSVMNGGQIAAANSEYQRKAGIVDSVERMTADILKAGEDLNHKKLIERMVAESVDTVQWTEKVLGVQYRDRVTQMGGHSVPRTLSTLNASGRDIVDPMLDIVRNLENVELMLSTAFETLIVEGDVNGRGAASRRVLGVRVKNTQDDHVENVFCDKGVVLAAGGFGADVEFRSIQNPSFGANVMSTNQPGATSECLKEALKIGAMPVQLSRIQLGPWTSPDETGFGKAPFFCAGAGLPYGIIVDPRTGRRFVNELDNRYNRSLAILKIGHPAVCIADSEGAKHSLKKEMDQLLPAVQSFETIADLATEYGIDAEHLKATIDQYNRFVAEGTDGAFGKPFRDDLKPISSPPYYAARLWPKVHHCMGGVHIDQDARVLNLDGDPIVGLYAAGEVAGGVHGGDRLGSVATLDCLFYGKVAGRTASLSK